MSIFLSEVRCTHYACRCARAAELAAMSEQAADPRQSNRLLAAAIAVHNEKVLCRQAAPDSAK